MNWIERGRKRSWPNLEYYPAFASKKNVNSDSWFLGQALNPGPQYTYSIVMFVPGESLYLLIHQVNFSSKISPDYHLKRRLRQVLHGCGKGKVVPVQAMRAHGRMEV
jgi:hypothetical protein